MFVIYRFLQVRYEDLGLHTEVVAKKIFKFLDLTYTSSVARFVKDHTSLTSNGIHKKKVSTYNTFRDSRTTTFAWRKGLSFSEVQNIQNFCGESLKKLKLNVFENENQYTNANISVLADEQIF